MKNPRAFLWIGLCLILFVNVQVWIKDFAPLDQAQAAAERQALEQQRRDNPLTAEVPVADVAPVPAAVAAGDSVPAPPVEGEVPSVAAPAAAAAPVAAGERTLNVRTDVLDVDISLRGAALTRADLLLYPVEKGGSVPMRLLRNNGAGDQYLLQTGLAGAGPGVRPEDFPTHIAQFDTTYNGFRLEEGQDELRVPFTWTSPAGVEVVKTLVFRRGSYRIDVEYAINNASTAPWSVAPYAQIQRDMPPPKKSYFNVDSYSFTGPAYWDGGKYEKLKIGNDDDARFNREFTDGWIAALQHHFVSAIIPPRDQPHHYTMSVRETEFLARELGPTQTVGPGASGSIAQTLFVGPKLQTQLEDIHPDLGRAADFGILTFLSRPLFWLLDKAHGIFANWGFAIIAVTFLLKLVFYPLSETSGRSMAKMKLVAPRMKQLQETYKDDRAKLGTAMMELYKKEKVNPAAGCLPMLVQLPVFLAFYWVLLESVEMRQAPFAGWIQDLSSRDPFFILPAIMAVAMFLQYKLQPTPADPVQAKVFMVLPLVMSVMFAFFPAGLVLYWVTNTILTIAQQWNINRRIEAAQPARN
ncbi:MAG TPA: membrane protein insertase YidC [Steroidobacteraceae bacterium]|nr:membrane protein insertase YidC [Steroidobacteraceae bacterium]